MKKYIYKSLRCLLTIALTMAVAVSWAQQQRMVTGRVLDASSKAPLIGATVVVDGTNVGATSNVDGSFSISAANNNSLDVRLIGYETQMVAVGERTNIEILLAESTQQIESVVVTALGLTRSEKSVGYAVSKVGGESIAQTTTNNWVSNLNGKVAGLSMNSAGTGPGGTVRVTLRGDSSLNYGSNEALFVIDGVPMMSNTIGSGSGANYANSDAPVDFGNGVTDINPDDIESVSVLKGPAASALYGSMAQNGVILITTKRGRQEKGIGVTFSSTVAFEKAGYFPDFQTEYGPSAVTTSITNTEVSAWGLDGSLTYDGEARAKQMSRYAYGDAYDSSELRYLYMSKDWETGEFNAMPWVYADDWFSGLFETGTTVTTNVAVDGATEKGTSLRFSATDVRNNWVLPNTGYDQQTYALSLNQKINKMFDLSAKVNYMKKGSDNMPMSGYSPASAMYGLIWGYTCNPISAYRDEYFSGRYTVANYQSGISSDPYNSTSGLIFNSSEGHNPYRVLYEELNKLDRDRVITNANLLITLLPELTINLRSGVDMNIEWRSQQKPFISKDYPTGMYREKTIRQYEYTSDFLMKYDKGFFADNLRLTAAFGGSSFHKKYFSITNEASELLNEGARMFSFANAATTVTTSSYRSDIETNSLYGFVNLAFKDTYFLDVTGRNDWSSTLHPTKWSFFYPSVSASVLLDKALNINTPIVDMIKLRGSIAQVGNATSAFQLYSDYSTTDYAGGYSIPSSIKNAYIDPEKTTSYEMGLNARLLQNRVDLDLAVYKNITTNQIISASQSSEVGATAITMNAGRIDNKGIEASIRVTPIRTKDFTWDISANWALNKNKLVSLQDGWDADTPLQSSTSTTIGGRVYIYSYVGESMQQIYGYDYERAPEGSTYTDTDGNVVDCSGMKIINESTGYPSFTSDPDQHIAQVNPDWKGGFSTTIRYKNLSMNALFTAQMGGNSYSVTNFALSYQGKLTNSLEGRYGGLVVDGVNATTNSDGAVVYSENKTITDNINTYYQTYKWNRQNAYENTFSTDFLKFKELRIDYTIPQTIIDKISFIERVTVGLFATNIFCISDWPQFDPEAASLVNGTNIYGGIETGTFPMTRTYGFNVKVQF
ncbi:MAG: SusC/RagA family TonB-linked outer membrane protein [Rikenellaceae bacterium]